MRICYLLETTNLSGGVRVVFDQARALVALGHYVIIRAVNGNHNWYPYPIDVDYQKDLDAPFLNNEKPEVVIATFWTTVHPAMKIGSHCTYHFCQGYEGDMYEYAPIRSEIENVYRINIPKLTIGPWLKKRLIEIYSPTAFPVYCVGQIVDTELFKAKKSNIYFKLRRIFGRPAKILVIGSFENSVKGVPCALMAVNFLKSLGYRVCLIRVSTSKTLEEDKICKSDLFLTEVSPKELSAIYQRCDILLASSLAHEGFGLPFAEALASGLPAVATKIPSHMSFDSRLDYAYFVQQENPEEMAYAAAKMLENFGMFKKFRERGLCVVERQFRPDDVANRLVQVFKGETVNNS